jgi:Mn-containing catalase
VNGKKDGAAAIQAERSEPGDSEVLRELFVQELQDMLHAEGQIINALPNMIKAAASPALQAALELHLEETKAQSSRLKEAFSILGLTATKKPCRGMAGILEEGEEVMEESKGKGSVARDLALIAAAQKVEHYEISAYSVARTMAQQLGQPEIARLLSKSLAEEENADSVLASCAKPLIAEAKLAGMER